MIADFDSRIPDPTGIPPLCSEEDFVEILTEMVADEVPRIFAIVHEYGDRVDARCAAWGLAFADHAEVVTIDGKVRFGLPTAEDALRRFRFSRHITPRLVWYDPSAATPCDEDDQEVACSSSTNDSSR
jgi:hypothetical protein